MAAATLAARRSAGGGLSLVALDVDASAARSYVAAGQYVEVRTPRGDGFFVLAGDVGAPRWELLVRNAGDAADALVNGAIGAALDVHGPLGVGFPLVGAKGRPLAVAAVGTAMAVARPVMRRRIADGDAAMTHLFLGVRAPADVPLAEEVDRWSRDGADVTLCLSRSDPRDDAATLPRARRETGYVQSALAAAAKLGRLRPGTLVVGAGPAPMLVDLRGLPAVLGATAEGLEVVTNV